MKGEGPDSCAVLTATTSGHPLSGATGAMEDHPTSIQVSTVKAGNFVTFFALFNFFLKNSFRSGLWIRSYFLRIRIRIQSLMLEANTDPDPDQDPIRIQGFNDQKLKKNYS
jgi:hypothetical protein